jgi:hypothetical protein
MKSQPVPYPRLLPGTLKLAPGQSRPAAGLHDRHRALHNEILAQIEHSIAVENHWLVYALLGWENLAACGVSYYLAEIAKLQAPHRWPYVLVWFAQIAVALATFHFVRSRSRAEDSPYKPLIMRVWTAFLFLSCNVAVLNVIAGLPVFTFLPVLATLSSFALLVLSALLSPRLLAGALVLFITGTLIAYFPAYGFLIYGAGWLIVLETVGLLLYRKRRQLLAGESD